MNSTSNDVMDLGERDWCGELRLTHRVAPFFLVFAVAVAAAVGFLEERDVDFAGEDFDDTRFFEAECDALAFFETDFFEVPLEGAAAVFGDPDWVGSVSRCWT